MNVNIIAIHIIYYTCIYIISATVPELARHEVGVVVHRAKRVQRFQWPTISDSRDQWSMMPMMDWSTINNWAAWTLPRVPFTSLKPLFRLPTSSSKFDSFPNPQNPPNQAQNASKTVPQTLPKRIQNSISSYNARNPKKCNPSIRKPHFWRFQTLKNRPKIDAKTPWKPALSWIPSWNPKKYDFWC